MYRHITYVYTKLDNFAVQQKLTEHCKSTIIKKIGKKKKDNDNLKEKVVSDIVENAEGV